MNYETASTLGRRWGIPPRAVSDLFYQRRLRDDLCPIVGKFRIIPASYVGEVKAALVRAGFKIRKEAVAHA